jgi:hypothetical protein
VQNLSVLGKLTGLTSLAMDLAESQIQSLSALKDRAKIEDLRIEVSPLLLASFPDDAKLRGATELTLIFKGAADQRVTIPHGFKHVSLALAKYQDF